MITTLIEDIAKRARAASLDLATLSTEAKNRFLERLATELVEQTDAIIAANALDLEAAKTNGLAGPMLERLSLTAERIAAMAEGVQQVAALPDPVGAEIERLSPPKGFDLRKIRVPMGVIGIIYESRPNVTVDCAILCLKSGNASILRGGKEAFNSNMKLAEIIRAALKAIFAQANQQNLVLKELSAIGSADYPVSALRPKNSELDCKKLQTAFNVQINPWQQSLIETLRVLQSDGL